MRCQVCQKNEVAIKMTRLVNGEMVDYHVCHECADKVSPHMNKVRKKSSPSKLTVEHLLKELMSQGDPTGGPAARVEDIVEIPTCPQCGTDYARFRETFMLGCPDCYDAFGERLIADLQKIQGATRHVESKRRSNGSVADLQARLLALRRELEESVFAEDFERAARLRDQIRHLQQAAAKSSAGETS